MTERGGFSIPEFARWAGFGRSKTYEEIAAGRLVARKCGKRTIITEKDGRDYLQSLPTIEPKQRAPSSRQVPVNQTRDEGP